MNELIPISSKHWIRFFRNTSPRFEIVCDGTGQMWELECTIVNEKTVAEFKAVSNGIIYQVEVKRRPSLLTPIYGRAPLTQSKIAFYQGAVTSLEKIKRPLEPGKTLRTKAKQFAAAAVDISRSLSIIEFDTASKEIEAGLAIRVNPRREVVLLRPISDITPSSFPSA